MRESLTVLAILLIVVLTTALVGPYFVDWNAHRGEIETRLSTLLGAKVAIAGPIDVKLLPRPIFRMQQVTVSGGSPEDGRASADRIDLELALTALLRGEIRFIEADISQPQLTLTVRGDRSILLPNLGSDPDRVSLAAVALHDGTLTLLGDDGHPAFRATGIEGEGSAESLAGPFRFAGQVDTARGELGFRVLTGAYDSGKMRLKATLDPVAGSPKTEVEGTITTGSAKAGSTVVFDGSLAAGSAIALAGSSATIPWTVATKLHAEAGMVEATDLELRAGAEGRALVATGTGHADLGPAMTATMALRARQADIGRLAVAPGDAADRPADTPPATPALADDLAALRVFALDADAFAGLPLPVTLDYGVDTVALGAETLANLAGTVRLGPGLPATGTLQVEAPDGSRLKLDGSFEPGPAAVFKGRAEVASRDLPRVADGFATDLPDLADWLKRTIPVKTFGFTGAVDLSAVGFAAHDASITLDRSSFVGTVTLTRAVGQDRARLFADLTSDALDLDALPDWRGTAATAAGLDLSLAVSARAIRLAQSDTGSLNAGRITLQLDKTGPAIRLDRLSLADLGGATAEISGRSDGKAAHAEGRFDARRLRDLLELVHRVLPSPATDELLKRADTLSPALLGIAADGVFGADGALSPTTLSVDGTAAGTKVSAHLKPDSRPSPADDALAGFRSDRPPFLVSLLLDAPETGVLLRQIGIVTPPSTAIGHGRIEATARLSPTLALDGTLAATFGDTVLSFKGRGAASGDLSGRLDLRGPNIAPLLRAVAVAAPEAGAAWPADAAADITWRDGRFTARSLAGHAVGMTFGGELAYVPPVAMTAATLAAGTTGSDVPPALTGSLAIDRLPLPALAGLELGVLAAAKPGAVWPDAPFTAPVLRLPRTSVALAATALPLTESLVARDAKLTMALAPGVVTLSALSAKVGPGRIDGGVTLRRDGAAASVSGHVGWADLPLATPSLGGRSLGSFDFAGTGGSLSALIASLAGSGTIGVDDARLPRFDPGAIGRVIASADAATATIDDSEIGQALALDLDQGALSLGNVGTSATVATGVIRGEPVKVDGAAIRAETVGALDLRSLSLSLKTTAVLKTAPKDWTGSAPQVSVLWKGPFGAPAREIDAAALVNGLAARAIGREQARIEAFQDDIRERAFFNRKLKVIEAEQQAARDKARADQEAERLKAPSAARPATDLANPKTPPAPKPDAKLEQGQKTPQDGISRLLDGLKMSPTLIPPPSPAARPLVRPGAAAKPFDLRHGAPIEAAAPPAGLADPGAAGRY